MLVWCGCTNIIGATPNEELWSCSSFFGAKKEEWPNNNTGKRVKSNENEMKKPLIKKNRLWEKQKKYNSKKVNKTVNW